MFINEPEDLSIRSVLWDSENHNCTQAAGKVKAAEASRAGRADHGRWGHWQCCCSIPAGSKLAATPSLPRKYQGRELQCLARRQGPRPGRACRWMPRDHHHRCRTDCAVPRSTRIAPTAITTAAAAGAPAAGPTSTGWQATITGSGRPMPSSRPPAQPALQQRQGRPTARWRRLRRRMGPRRRRWRPSCGATFRWVHGSARAGPLGALLWLWQGRDTATGGRRPDQYQTFQAQRLLGAL
eukprot:SAG22_NODE_2666_length_2322_cov_2.226271_1_plen_239_part_00